MRSGREMDYRSNNFYIYLVLAIYFGDFLSFPLPNNLNSHSGTFISNTSCPLLKNASKFCNLNLYYVYTKLCNLIKSTVYLDKCDFVFSIYAF